MKRKLWMVVVLIAAAAIALAATIWSEPPPATTTFGLDTIESRNGGYRASYKVAAEGATRFNEIVIVYTGSVEPVKVQVFCSYVQQDEQSGHEIYFRTPPKWVSVHFEEKRFLFRGGDTWYPYPCHVLPAPR